MIGIEFGEGQTLLVTPSTPVMTDMGLVPADELAPGDYLDGTGDRVQVEGTQVERWYGGVEMVWIDGPGTFIAQGIVIGSLSS